ncbi:MAG: hypothetical protein J6D47_09145 [Peptostreptococcaceae bacterium]|nr:hypothetical protein [Peptostreptococcaceae bacterium]
MKDEILKKSYLNAFDIKDKYIKDMLIVITKSLVDDANQRCVKIDDNRLRDELIYYKFYGEKINDLNIINILLPIIISNTNIQRSEDEVLKTIKNYTLYNKKEEYLSEYILGSLIYNTLIHSIIDNKNIEYNDLMQNIKTRIIEFVPNLEKSKVIKFEMCRIKTIQAIDKNIDLYKNEYSDNDIILNLLNVIYDVYIEDREVDIDGVNSMKKSILSILDFELNTNIDNIDFIKSMSEYIIKLRKYKINKKAYSIKSDPRYLIGLEVGDTKQDPILNNIKVISKNFVNNVLKIKVISKSGNYDFKFIKS